MTIDMGLLPGSIASSRPAAGTPTLGGAAQPVDRISAQLPRAAAARGAPRTRSPPSWLPVPTAGLS